MAKRLSGQEILAEAVRLRTYSKTKADGKKETLDENVDRVIAMHVQRFPHLEKEINSAFKAVKDLEVVPSMRSMQFAKQDIVHEKNYNCSFLNVTTVKDFSDILYLLACGAGVGYSVQRRHIDFLPVISVGAYVKYAIADTKESWADSISTLVLNPQAEFDYSQIRPAGASLSSGGTASGPQPLIDAHVAVRKVLQASVGRKMTPAEVSDVICHIAIAIVSGGTRRSALICLFDADNTDMLEYKSGEWWIKNPQRGKANVSAILHRQDPDVDVKFKNIIERCYASNAGEPGIYWVNDLDYGTNPCCEIALRSHQFCNLTSVNVSKCVTEHDFYRAVTQATIIGTFQASMTSFSYIGGKFKENCEEEALLGVSMTGIAENWGLLTAEVLQAGAALAKQTNIKWAEILGIKPAARITCVKPEGSSSVILSTTSGIHAAHAPFYIRRVRFSKIDPIGKYLAAKAPLCVEDDIFDPYSIVFSVPVKKTGAIQRNQETAIELLERAKHVTQNWVVPGHVSGPNTHNVSLTVNYHEHEREAVAIWMKENMKQYNGISLLPYSGGSYQQLPFEEITEEIYNEWLLKIPETLNFQDISFINTVDRRSAEVACGGGSCEVV